ncbi:alpha-D-ribose 1-methylphosphonate 5-phosphate C-P-lyase PhnJ [Brevibacillus choshinensis]|uniref:Alpha-D-ribose 1-methylphosphonate 5-phosphate C-P-lyase PhnJ n=1 Tax=Brevibacillus choshinensis TaxID=54911 RepID=A0ABX7FTW0_BRECH|nr:alpha-D-ribose 1-methylphosphonate 5-phosphate C-P-lyase PhnJ [Brevibacillus choshinensis]QRG69072.1 alpha-D-ribose 1-methylphosphonate 5-phosphate C-P-lyase PhnJ [Brevibacillus choshinensis]
MSDYNFAFFDEGSKREIRRATLKAVAIPGYQVPFASREMPIGRGWGTGGLQLTLSLVGKRDVLKVIDQGSDESVNAVNIKKLVQKTTGIRETEETSEATIIQSRHRIPEIPLHAHQIMVLQVPICEPLREYEPSEFETKKLHGEKEYSGAWLMLFEQIMRYGSMSTGAAHPVMVQDRYVMTPSPIPRFDNPKMNHSEALILLGAGREKKVFAVPPYTKVVSLAFDDYPFQVESSSKQICTACGATGVFMDELVEEDTGETYHQCNDTSYCLSRLNSQVKLVEVTVHG